MRQHSGRLLPVGRNDDGYDDGYDDGSAAGVRLSARARRPLSSMSGVEEQERKVGEKTREFFAKV